MPNSIIDVRDEDVYLVTSSADGIDSGMIVTWIAQASMSTRRPRIVAVLSPRNRTTELVERSGRFVAHLLAEEQFELVPRFGLHSSRNTEKFKGLELSRASSGAPIIPGSRGWIECQVTSKIDAGDRFVYLADIIARSPVQTNLKSLRVSVALSRLPRDVAAALSKKREADTQLDDDILRRLQG